MKDWERIKHIKETFCYSAVDFEKELANFGKDKEQRYTLPDGMIVNINNEALVYFILNFQQNITGKLP